MNINLSPGQYQLSNSDLVFGRNTPYEINSIELQSYNIVPQDAQWPNLDRIQFGSDLLGPGPILIKMSVLDNRLIPNMLMLDGTEMRPGLETFDATNKRLLNKLATAWRGDSARKIFGEAIALRCCERDGSTKVWLGRPRKFQPTKRSAKSGYFSVDAEFQRLDTLVYSDEEYASVIAPGDNVTVTRLDGDLATYIRILLVGPINHPVISYGDAELDLDYNIIAGEIVEISSYPWQQRVVSSLGLNIGRKLIGESRYLDQLTFPMDPAGFNVSFTGTSGATSDTKLLFCWRDAFAAMT